MLIALHALHRAVFDVDDAVGHRRDGAVVRDDHDRHTLLPAGVLQELEDLLAGHIVERAGRLVRLRGKGRGEEQGGSVPLVYGDDGQRPDVPRALLRRI